MDNEVRFNIRLNIDGKDKVVTATTAVDNLHHVADEAKGGAGGMEQFLQRLVFTQEQFPLDTKFI